ncbi:MAG: ATP-dependent DNA helicase RecG [Acidimicrobiia bacterium]|nr:ATP-dependent DNA helicase RecG [Acidimicrobiia bacterium]
MPGRSLAYLSTLGVENVKGLKGKRSKALEEAGITSVADLLLHAPRRYLDRSTTVKLADVPLGEEITVMGRVTKTSMRRVRRNMTIVDAVITDESGAMAAVWFNQAFRHRQLQEGAEVALSGKAERYRGKLQMSSPAVDVLDTPSESLITGRVVPIHPTVGGVGPGYLRRAIHNAIGRSRPIEDPVPPEYTKRLKLMSRDEAIGSIHFPDTYAEAMTARKRLVYDELFRLEVALALRKRRQMAESNGLAHTPDGALVERFKAALPYELTGAQKRSIDEIAGDMAAPHAMHRLLQGEVGSGKTVVAVASLLAGVQGGYQGAVMAPTEVLATQHYLGIRSLLESADLAPPQHQPDGEAGTSSMFDDDGGDGPFVRCVLLTSTTAEANDRAPGGASRDEVLEMISTGDADIVVGTHSLIQEGVEFASLGVAVVDEQHRFGVWQRVGLREKGRGADPDLLIMTATPIPRTLAMTLYGDLDVSVLDEMPPGRTPVTTTHLVPEQASTAHDFIRAEAADGRQAFVVCPLVEDSDKLEVKSATAEFGRLKGVFPDLRLGLIHGQLHPVDKDAVMSAFRAGDLDVLVATTVIEVGIDVPNATVMVIEDADRFGLSQLHQLRGRVGRGEHASSCYLIAEPTTPEGEARIEAMVATTDGFRLAEEDLRIRGQGTVFGTRQAGMKDLRLADILRDAELLIEARRDAFGLVNKNPDLSDHPEVRDEVMALLGEDVTWLFRS